METGLCGGEVPARVFDPATCALPEEILLVARTARRRPPRENLCRTMEPLFFDGEKAQRLNSRFGEPFLANHLRAFSYRSPHVFSLDFPLVSYKSKVLRRKRERTSTYDFRDVPARTSRITAIEHGRANFYPGNLSKNFSREFLQKCHSLDVSTKSREIQWFNLLSSSPFSNDTNFFFLLLF